MFSLKPLPQFSAWLDALPDITVRSVVVARLKRLELGLLGDVEPVGVGYRNCAFTWVPGGVCISSSAAHK